VTGFKMDGPCRLEPEALTLETAHRCRARFEAGEHGMEVNHARAATLPSIAVPCIARASTSFRRGRFIGFPRIGVCLVRSQ